jgi:hypothetical protein
VVEDWQSKVGLTRYPYVCGGIFAAGEVLKLRGDGLRRYNDLI